MPQEIISWSGLKKLGNNQVLNVAQRWKCKKHWACFRDPVSGEHFLVSQPGRPNWIFFPAWSVMSFTEIIFLVFLCSPFHSTSYSSVLLCSFLWHFLTVSHFPDDHCVSTIQQAAGLTVLWTANLQELICLMSSIRELSLEFSIDISFLSVQLISFRVNVASLSFKFLAFFFPWVCIALNCSLLRVLSLDSLLHNFCLFMFCFIITICYLGLLF